MRVRSCLWLVAPAWLSLPIYIISSSVAPCSSSARCCMRCASSGLRPGSVICLPLLLHHTVHQQKSFDDAPEALTIPKSAGVSSHTGRHPRRSFRRRGRVTLHLCQGCLWLRKPEGHTHGAVQDDSRYQCGMRLLSLASLQREGAKATMAVRLEWVHSQRFGQGKGLLVVDGSLLDCGRLLPCCNIAEKMQGISLVATFLVLTGERQCPLGEGVRLL